MRIGACDEGLREALNVSKEAWNGNEPAIKDGKHICGEPMDRWVTRWGGGLTWRSEFYGVEFILNPNIKAWIYLDHLHVSEITQAYYAEYSNKALSFNRCLHHRWLDKEEVRKILMASIPDCQLWEMFQKKALELIV